MGPFSGEVGTVFSRGKKTPTNTQQNKTKHKQPPRHFLSLIHLKQMFVIT